MASITTYDWGNPAGGGSSGSTGGSMGNPGSNNGGSSNNNTTGGTTSGTTSGGYGGGYSGSGGGGGYSHEGPTDEQKHAADNLGGLTGWNQDTILGAAKNADDLYDVSDKQNESLLNQKKLQARRTATNDWYTQQQKLQSVAANLRESIGNGFYGSTLYDFWDLLARKDDMDDVSVLNSLRENIDDALNSYYEAIMATNNARNQMYLETEQNLRDLAGDYAGQLNNIHPDLADEVIEKGENGGGTLNVPDWLQTEYYESHRRGPIEAKSQDLFRPANALSDAWSQGLLTGQKNTASAANKSYWERMNNGYNRRG